jgi:hypothetical protein
MVAMAAAAAGRLLPQPPLLLLGLLLLYLESRHISSCLIQQLPVGITTVVACTAHTAA